MAFKSKIELTFNTDLALGADIYFRLRSQYTPWSVDTTQNMYYEVVTARAAAFQVTQASNPTAIPGERTAINFYDAFNADWGFYTMSRSGNKVTIITVTADDPANGFYFTWVLASSWAPTLDIVITNVYDDSVDPPAPVEETLILEPIPFKDMSIRLIDTYVNGRVLIDELLQVDAAELRFDAGDTKFKEVMASSLAFNMAVQDKVDAKFFHLLTGDEKRYRVELIAIDENENEVLYWKGFLLPDQYNEPYTNATFFVNFEATDNLALLKNYTLPPWYFGSRYPLMKLLAYLLKDTGLNQSIIIAPSILPNQPDVKANLINVPIQQYKDGQKFTDNAQILEDVLGALGLTIYNFRGYWFVVGLSRKHELEMRYAEVYNTNGEFVEYAKIVRQVVDYFANETPSLSAVPAYSKVIFNLDVDNRLNVFPDNVAKSDFKSTEYVSYQGFQSTNIGHTRPVFIDKMVASWLKVGGSNYNLFDVENTQFVYNIGTSVETTHNMNEATALSNYFSPAGQFYVLKGFKYSFRFEIVVYVKTTTIPTSDDYDQYDPMVPFQMLVNGVEVYSKRPGNTATGQKQFSRQLREVPGGFEMTFSYEDEVYFRQSGVLEMRLLNPIWNNASGSIPSLIKLQKMELLEQEKNDYLEFVEAVRPLKNTVYLDKSLKFVSSSNTAIRNNFGIGAPINASYDWNFTSLNNGDTYTGLHSFREGPTVSAVDRVITLLGKDISEALLRVLFQENYKDFVFIKNSVTGEEKSFTALYGHLVRNFISTFTVKMGYLYDYENEVILPDGYEKYQDSLNGWDFYYRKVDYNYEVVADRDNWKIFGQTSGDTFLRQLARVFAYTHPSVMFRFEGVEIDLMQPDSLLSMYYNNDERNYIPTSIVLNLPSGKTTITSAVEAKYEEVTDINFK